MSFEKNFCSSPWFHMRINNAGSYEYCRWKKHEDSRVNFIDNIKTTTPTEYFQTNLAPIRQSLLEGKVLPGCQDCANMEQHNKISGRQRQLLKVGIQERYFKKSLASSPLKKDFDYSWKNNGDTTRTISDWQIDLGNYCNGACIYCDAESSSKLATELHSLGLIEKLPPNSWCDDPVLLDRFIQDLTSSNNLKYLHFIGGETLITPGFKKILQAVVDSGRSKDITIGFTTNLSMWKQDIVELLDHFHLVNLGLSIDTLSPVNDYVRWPSQHLHTRKLLDQWVAYGKERNWLIQLRTTPTCLTVGELPSVYDYAWENNISVESCNFLYKPEFLRINVLPKEHRQKIQEKLQYWISQHLIQQKATIVNTRDPGFVQMQICQDAESYISYLINYEDESNRLPELVKYLKILENNRKNSILDYLPEYEQLFRSAGY